MEVPYDRRGHATAARAIAWLQGRDRAAPFFLWVHFFDPHQPYNPPALERAIFATSAPDTPGHAIDLYDGEIKAADSALGLLVDELARLRPNEENLIIATSDHGEGLGDHGFMAHGVFLYDEMVRVPLVWNWPEQISKGLRVAGLTAQIDLLPTLVGLTGMPLVDATTHGIDHSAVLRGEAQLDPNRAIFLQRREYKTQMPPVSG